MTQPDSSIPGALEDQLRQLAARISVIAEAPGISYIPAGDHVYDSKTPTTARGRSLLEEFKDRLARTNGPMSQRALIEWAERMIRARTHTPPAPKRKLKDRILEDYEGVDCRVIAELEGQAVHFTTIWRWRVAAGQDHLGRQVEDKSAA